MKKSVFLRAFEPDDYVLINKWRNDPEIQQLTGGTFRYVSSAREKEWVEDKIKNNTYNIYWAICLNDDSKKMIGYTSINDIDYVHRTVFGGGVVIGDREYRNGITLIDANVIKYNYVFNELNLRRLEGTCLVKHETSLHMMLMLGYKIEGIRRQAVYKNGNYHDQYLCALLKEDFLEINNSGGYEVKSVIKRLREIKRKTQENMNI